MFLSIYVHSCAHILRLWEKHIRGIHCIITDVSFEFGLHPGTNTFVQLTWLSFTNRCMGLIVLSIKGSPALNGDPSMLRTTILIHPHAVITNMNSAWWYSITYIIRTSPSIQVTFFLSGKPNYVVGWSINCDRHWRTRSIDRLYIRKTTSDL